MREHHPQNSTGPKANKKVYSCYAARNRGFSFIELTVSLAIFTLLTGAVMLSQSTLNNRLNIESLSQQIAQWVRDAQISALSVRRTTQSSVYTSGYGLHFDIATPNQFIYFADRDKNGKYETVSTSGGPNDEIEQTVSLLQGYSISLLCVVNSGTSGSSCPSGLGALSNGKLQTSVLDVTFKRPNPDAVMKGSVNGQTYSPSYITISSPKGYNRTIVVYATGQVSIN